MSRRIKLLHTTMSLDIGGAETHIVELAKELQASGYEVHVASNGGVYEKELAMAGIKHHRLPLHTKNPFAVIKSYIGLRRIILKEQIDIVHAHARIPGFISGILSRQLNRKFVTTTHGKFKVNYLLRHITNWGRKSIAVSEDLKRYLLKEYEYAEEDIRLSVNGIDVQKFSPKDRYVDKRHCVVHVSRLDATTSQTAEWLIDLATHIHDTSPELRLTIVGGGTELERLKVKAKQVNDALGFQMIEMTGPVDDVPSWLDKACVFVGISRSVLEAMNYRVPIVLAGDYGYYGLLDQEGLASNQENNFTCRGGTPLSIERLEEGVVSAIEAWQNKVDMSYLGDFVMTHYSVKVMSEPYLTLYEELIKAPKRYIVAGYYGYSNSGDDALLASISKDLVEDNAGNQVTILTKDPEGHERHPQVKAVYRFDLLKVIKALHRSDILIMGGGSLLQDKTSTRSLWYYLALIGLANRMHKRCYLYANGIGPINGKFNGWLTKKIVADVAVITLREAKSYKTLQSMGIKGPHVEVTADPVFHLDLLGEKHRYEPSLLPEGFDPNKPFCVAIFREWGGSTTYVPKVAKVCDHIINIHGLQVLFIPMKFPTDMRIQQKILDIMECGGYMMSKQCSVADLVSIINEATLTVSMRLHGVIYSAICSVPVVGFSYDPKVTYYSQMLGMPVIEDIGNMDIDKAISYVDKVMASYDESKNTLQVQVAHLTEQAKVNAQILKSLL